ncbi:MAG: tyrosine-type recombinase/integrase [Anaerolineales bacterium]|jgi:integrase/recombinase XerD
MDISIQRFLQHLHTQEDAAENTLLAYATDLEQFQRVLKAHGDAFNLLAALDHPNVRHYVDWLSHQGYQPATITRKMAAVRSYLSYIEAYEHTPTSHLMSLLNAPPSPQVRPLTLSRAELKALIEAPQKESGPGPLRDAAILNVLYETGFRANEVVNLQISDLDMQRSLIRRPGSDDAWIPLTRSADILKQYMQDGRPNFLKHAGEKTLFLNQRGKGLSRQGLWLVVKRWAEEAGLNPELSPQTLRHTRTQHLLEQGLKKSEVQRFLGLSSPNALRIHYAVNERDEY